MIRLQKVEHLENIQGVQGEILCIDARIGLWAQSAYLAKD